MNIKRCPIIASLLMSFAIIFYIFQAYSCYNEKKQKARQDVVPDDCTIVFSVQIRRGEEKIFGASVESLYKCAMSKKSFDSWVEEKELENSSKSGVRMRRIPSGSEISFPGLDVIWNPGFGDVDEYVSKPNSSETTIAASYNPEESACYIRTVRKISK